MSKILRQNELSMINSIAEDFGKVVVQRPAALNWARTTWGEEARVLVSPLQSGQPFCIMDYAAPAHFGPPRHIHLRDDEILRLVEGSIVLWSPGHCTSAKAGDVIILPKGVAHTWRSLDCSVRMEVTLAPGDLEPFFQRFAEERVTRDQVSVLDEMARWVGVENIGPPLSKEEADLVLSGGQLS